ncbi:GNAT family N-acetyltransferase [Exiguobacterium sp. 17-1]|uniref:GNAT family N-acetyltransferase n=1 Tax=Exiguobacterium sp. 17-1 TaxID=2931981 RepID=UPI001FFED4EE|nr:GNAT family N-acetyltransferase [Exiguobacterium sp. 17-1]MCK2156478.1 GNAT family N-acetyltransferase [Exiguobacterium sp. 17-1]
MIRAAVLEDAAVIARIHVASWRERYRTIMPDPYLDHLSAENREPGWRKSLAEGPVFVALDQTNEIIGFANGGPSRKNSVMEGELYALYLLKSHQGQGTGKRLFDHVLEDLRQQGCSSCVVNVLADNPSRFFYERFGGRLVSGQPIERGGKQLIEYTYRIMLQPSSNV